MGLETATALMGAVSLGSQIAGGLSSTVGSYYDAKSQKSALKTQAFMSDINAQLAERSAQSELRKGNDAVGQLTLQAGALKGKQRAALAANGVDLGEGSAAEMLASTDLMKEIDMNTLQANAVRSAWGYRTESVNHQVDALMSRAAAKSISPKSAAFSTLLSSAGSVAGSWMGMKQAGIFDSISGAAVSKVGSSGLAKYSTGKLVGTQGKLYSGLGKF